MDIWVLVLALVTAYLIPGPDMLLILQVGANQGRCQALATAAGFAIARMAHVALAGAGLAALLKTAPWAYGIVRIVGATYLVWLGIKIWRAPSLLPERSDGTGVVQQSWQSALWQGGMISFANPKALLFCSVLLPQFIDPAGRVAAQFVVLGAVLTVTGLLFDLLYGCAGVFLGQWLARSVRAQIVQRWLCAGVLIGFGARLALVGQLQ